MKIKIKTLLAVLLLAAFVISCGSQKKGKRMSNSGHHHKIKTEMGGM